MEWKITVDEEYLVHRGFKEEEHPRGKDGRFVASGSKDEYSKLSSEERQKITRERNEEMAFKKTKANYEKMKYEESPEFKKQQAAEEASKKEKEFESEIETSVSDVGKESSKAISSASKILRKNNGSYVEHPDYSDISDEELKKRVNRLNMEEQYARLNNDNKYVKSGKEKAADVLDTIGDVLAFVTAAGGVVYAGVKIAQAIKGHRQG